MAKRKAYFVEYNAKYVGFYKTLRGALNLVARKGYTNDYDNVTRIVDNEGNMYDIFSGKEIEY